jgi:hypothetical protein
MPVQANIGKKIAILFKDNFFSVELRDGIGVVLF